MQIIERKIRYNGTIAEYDCEVLEMDPAQAVLTYLLPEKVTVGAVTLPAGSRTFAYYWMDRPYNVYIWKNPDGKNLAAYFNIVRNTRMTNRVISYEDLIVDLLVLPDGRHCVLDREELPEAIETFERGYVYKALNELMDSVEDLLTALYARTNVYSKKMYGKG